MSTIVFFFTAFVAVVSAVMVISRDNPVHSVMWLILNMVSLAVLYFTLQAPFLMAAQLIVYAGAVVVLFLFVVMLLISKGQSGGTSEPLRWLSPVTYLAALLLGVVLLMVALARPAGAPLGGAGQVIGTPYEVGMVLFRDYLLPFEATSVLLLTALVGAMYLGRHSDKSELGDEEAGSEARPEPLPWDRTDDQAAGIPEDSHA